MKLKIKFNKESLPFYFWIVFLLILLFWFLNIISYFDPINFCYIKIEGDIIRGEESTIHKALVLIKKEDKQAYKDICKYTDVISEKYCIVADWQINHAEYTKGLNLPGCYARGSKTIYLKPDKTISETTIRQRKENIIKYSEFSKNFWTQN